LLELIFVLGIAATVGGIAVPQLLASLDDYRAAGAARYLTARIQRVRMEAITRSTNTAIQFVAEGAGFSFGVYMDGNGDGVRTADITDAIDPRVGATERLPDNFPGVEFGLLEGLPPVDAGGAAPGTDPIKLGGSNLLSYAAAGTSTSGSIYIRGRKQSQYVIRVFGDTGRTRTLAFDSRARQWRPL
jgi:type II secretory pathway pseudopilin PulG